MPRKRPPDTVGVEHISKGWSSVSQQESADGIKKLWIHARKPTLWLVAAVVGTLISVSVGRALTDSTDEAQRTALHATPLRVTALPSSEMPPNGFAILVETPADFPAGFASVDDCQSLWSKGLEMGGTIINPATWRLVLANSTQDTIAITDMRALVIKSEPAKNGTLLRCPPDLGGTPPIAMAFDLNTTNRAVATIESSDGTMVPQFRDGFVITFESGEVVPLAATAFLPPDSVTWAIEADVLIDGQTHVTEIDGGSEGFVTAGRMSDNQYEAGVLVSQGGRGKGSTWGVDRNFTTTRSGNGQLRIGNLFTLPDKVQVDVYQTGGREVEHEQRWVRSDGRLLMRFNPPGVTAALEEPTQRCGTGSTREVLESFMLMHDDEAFEHINYAYRCGSGDNAQSVIVRTARVAGSDILFIVDEGRIDKNDVNIATEMLNAVRISS